MIKARYNLMLYVDSKDEECKSTYINKSLEHNKKVETNEFPDSGFDLFIPTDYCSDEFYNKNRLSDVTFKMPLQIKCAMIDMKNEKFVGYYLYPRSSIIKTPFRLANSVGIIDSGYRGEITGVVDKNDPINDWKFVLTRYCKKMDRLFQICSPNLSAFTVEIVDNESDLGITERGQGGFGSTGR